MAVFTATFISIRKILLIALKAKFNKKDKELLISLLKDSERLVNYLGIVHEEELNLIREEHEIHRNFLSDLDEQKLKIQDLEQGLLDIKKDRDRISDQIEKLKKELNDTKYPDLTEPLKSTINKSYLRKKLAQNKCLDVIKFLQPKLINDDDLYKDFCLISAKFNRVEKLKNNGLMSNIDYELLSNSIVISLLYLINQMK